MKREPENDAVLRLLGWSDVALRRTMLGCIYLLAVAVPDWIRQCLCDMIDVGSSFLYRTSKTATRLSIYGFRVAYMIARVSLVALGWGLVIFSPLGIVVMGSANWLFWPSMAWSFVLMFGSLSGYLRWRAFEDRARAEWRDVVIKGCTVQEWAMEVVGEGVSPNVRQAAVRTLLDNGTKGQMALMAILVLDERVEIHVTAKMWVLAVLGEIGPRVLRFELAVRNLHLVSRNPRIKRAALSTLSQMGAKIDV